MSTATKVSALDHATQSAHTWVCDVAREFDTEDREFAYRVLRAWRHTRAIGLPWRRVLTSRPSCLIRGILYAGWNPSGVPKKYDVEEYVLRFAHEANIAHDDVGKAAAATTAAALHRLPAAQMEKALEQLPPELRAVLLPRR